MNFFKIETLRLIRSKLLPITITLSVMVFSTVYLFILNSPGRGIMNIREVYRILPTLIALILPLFTQGMWYGEVESVHIGIIKKSRYGVLKLLIDKVLFFWGLSILITLIVLPLTLFIGRYGEIIYRELLSIYIGLVLFNLLAVNIGLLLSTLLKGRFLIYISTVIVLTFLLSGRSGELYIFIPDSLGRFYNGYIKVSDILLYLLSSGTIFAFSIFRVEPKQRKLFFIILLFPLIMIPGGIDLSLGRRNTLNPVTRDLLGEARVPVSIDYYGTREIKEITSQLKEYSRNPNLNFRKVIGESEEMERAIKRFKPIEIGEGNYSFIVIEYLTRYSVIPVASIGERVEFDIYNEIEFLLKGEEESVAILLGDSNFKEDDFTTLKKILEDEFFVEYIHRGETIPGYIDTLMVIGHRDLGFSELSKVGDYLSEGGSLIIAANGVDTFGNLEVMNTSLLYALEDAGIYIDPYLIGDNRNLGVINEEGRVVPFPLNIIAKNPPNITNLPLVYPGIDVLGVYSSPVRFRSESAQPLLESSNESWIVDSGSGLYSENHRVSSLAVFDKLIISPYFGGNGTKISNILVSGSTRSLTNLSMELGDYSTYEFIARALYKLQERDQVLELRQSLDHIYRYNKNPGGHLYVFMLFLYPGLVLLSLMVLKRRL